MFLVSVEQTLYNVREQNHVAVGLSVSEENLLCIFAKLYRLFQNIKC